MKIRQARKLKKLSNSASSDYLSKISERYWQSIATAFRMLRGKGSGYDHLK